MEFHQNKYREVADSLFEMRSAVEQVFSVIASEHDYSLVVTDSQNYVFEQAGSKRTSGLIHVNLSKDCVRVEGFYFGTVLLHEKLVELGVPHRYAAPIVFLDVNTALDCLSSALDGNPAERRVFTPASRQLSKAEA